MVRTEATIDAANTERRGWMTGGNAAYPDAGDPLAQAAHTLNLL